QAPTPANTHAWTRQRVSRGGGCRTKRHLSVTWATIDAGISTGGRHGQPAEVMRPTLVVADALRRVGKTAMGHAQQGAAVPVDQVDLDQARSRRHLFIPVPTEAVGEAVDRHDLAERSARHAAADTFDKIEPARMRLGLYLGAHPAQDLFGIGQEGEDGGGRGCDMGLTLDHERFSHRSLLAAARMAAPEPVLARITRDKGAASTPGSVHAALFDALLARRRRRRDAGRRPAAGRNRRASG